MLAEVGQPFHHVNAGATTGVVVKATPGVLQDFNASNEDATNAAFVKFYDKATAPTSSDTPKRVFKIPAGGGTNPAFPRGIQFHNGISFRVCAGIADNDDTAVSASEVALGGSYQ